MTGNTILSQDRLFPGQGQKEEEQVTATGRETYPTISNRTFLQ